MNGLLLTVLVGCSGMSIVFFMLYLYYWKKWHISEIQSELKNTMQHRQTKRTQKGNKKKVKTQDGYWEAVQKRNISRKDTDEVSQLDIKKMMDLKQQNLESIKQAEAKGLELDAEITEEEWNSMGYHEGEGSQQLINNFRQADSRHYEQSPMDYNQYGYTEDMGYYQQGNSQPLEQNYYEQATGYLGEQAEPATGYLAQDIQWNDLNQYQQEPATGYLEQATGYLNQQEGYFEPATGYLGEQYEQPTGYLNEQEEQPTGYLGETGYYEQTEQPTGYLNEQYEQPTGYLNEQYEQPTGYLGEQYEQPTGYLGEQYEQPTGYLGEQEGYSEPSTGYLEQPTGYLNNFEQPTVNTSENYYNIGRMKSVEEEMEYYDRIMTKTEEDMRLMTGIDRDLRYTQGISESRKPYLNRHFVVVEEYGSSIKIKNN